MKNHTLEIIVQPDNTALCWHGAPAFGSAQLLGIGYIQRLTLNDGENRVEIGVRNRKISLEDIRRIARQAVDGNYDPRA